MKKVTKLYRNWFMTENEIGVKEGFLYTDAIYLGSVKPLNKYCYEKKEQK